MNTRTKKQNMLTHACRHCHMIFKECNLVTLLINGSRSDGHLQFSHGTLKKARDTLGRVPGADACYSI